MEIKILSKEAKNINNVNKHREMYKYHKKNP